MTNEVKTLRSTRYVTETFDGKVFLQSEDKFQTLAFLDKNEMYEFFSQLIKIIPPPQNANLEGKYLGEPWKYDKF